MSKEKKEQVFWNGAWFDKFQNETDMHAVARLRKSLRAPESQFMRRTDERGWRS